MGPPPSQLYCTELTSVHSQWSVSYWGLRHLRKKITCLSPHQYAADFKHGHVLPVACIGSIWPNSLDVWAVDFSFETICCPWIKTTLHTGYVCGLTKDPNVYMYYSLSEWHAVCVDKHNHYSISRSVKWYLYGANIIKKGSKFKP